MKAFRTRCCYCGDLIDHHAVEPSFVQNALANKDWIIVSHKMYPGLFYICPDCEQEDWDFHYRKVPLWDKYSKLCAEINKHIKEGKE
jgi:hypothetical protein